MSNKKPAIIGKRGKPLPLGTTILLHGINFSFFSRHARSVQLIIECFDKKQVTEYVFDLDPQYNRTGDIWHILLPLNHQHIRYGFRVNGKTDPERGTIFSHENILIDPYCTQLVPRTWGEESCYGKSPCCEIHDTPFDWQGETPIKRPLTETIIYELHVRGFTQSSTSKTDHPGTYQGIVEKIPYLKELGITAVELMPVAEFDENDNFFRHPETKERHKNFWGYNSINFFAVKSAYAANPYNHINEFKEMVRELHRAGIEVILDIVFNHSGEGGYDGTTSSFRGIDNPTYYLLDSDTREYMNFSGCGNTMNCNHPIVRELILDVLRYWVIDMHVDGFRFDLASIMGRDTDGTVLSDPPMLAMIAEDPVLRDTKIIAEAWDAVGLYQVGSFSTDSRWSEWNGKFRDDVRRFFSGKASTVSDLATRIAGSADLYQHGSRGPANSINFITSHDGFTLRDLVSYNEKHNFDNGEENRDGDNHNFSWNSGAEGITRKQDINELRLRRMKSMALILLLSQGVPMITAGDEFGRSQQGNNNCWCQDNPLSWVDWTLTEKNGGLLRFFMFCIALRKEHAVFRRSTFFTDNDSAITWQSLVPGQIDWSAKCHHLGFLLNGAPCNDDHFFIAANGHQEKSGTFTLPSLPEGEDSEKIRWKKIIDTSLPSPYDCVSKGKATTFKNGDMIPVANMACMVFTI